METTWRSGRPPVTRSRGCPTIPTISTAHGGWRLWPRIPVLPPHGAGRWLVSGRNDRLDFGRQDGDEEFREASGEVVVVPVDQVVPEDHWAGFCITHEWREIQVRGP